jgi:hypothetical protein
MVYELADATSSAKRFAREIAIDVASQLITRLSTDPRRRGACARARNVFDRRYDCKNDCYSESDRKSCKNEPRDHATRSPIRKTISIYRARVFICPIPARVGPVERLLAPLKDLDDGGCHHDSDRDKYSQLDDHFANPDHSGIILVRQWGPSTRSVL